MPRRVSETLLVLGNINSHYRWTRISITFVFRRIFNAVCQLHPQGLVHRAADKEYQELDHVDTRHDVGLYD